MRVLVTGGSGKAGAYTVREMAEAGHEVLNVDRMRPAQQLPGSFIQLAIWAGSQYHCRSGTRSCALVRQRCITFW